MSLYGDGRRDGLLAALAIVVISLGVRVMGHTVAIDGDLLAALRPAALPALGGVLCYRLLRALGCSRYAGFLVGAGYAVSPWSLALAARLGAILGALLLLFGRSGRTIRSARAAAAGTAAKTSTSSN